MKKKIRMECESKNVEYYAKFERTKGNKKQKVD